MKLSRDILSLSVFKRDTAKFMRQMKKTKEPIVLTVNGKAALVVHDAATYDDYLRDKERNEVLAAIRRGREDAKEGREQDAEEFFEEFFGKYGIAYDE
ncbi:MAG: prevent-host-death family protein [Acidobacteria bacterium OLB17]|nr:MAG: prevent-host-death family protein [Acidobacteria bacterium OLB17]MCZ2391175.1 type II toxin-antitoxin system Phd/YefM family antitoxin [Acidobacteriota bacterium]